jgi:hypothetical protein
VLDIGYYLLPFPFSRQKKEKKEEFACIIRYQLLNYVTSHETE